MLNGVTVTGRFVLFFILVFPFKISKAQATTNYKVKSVLGDVIVKANKLETELKDVPTKIDIIDEAKIKRTNGERLPEILKQSSSIFIKSYGITPELQTLSINGLGTEHTLILLDGVRLNSFQNSQIDLSLIPLQNIERIEVVNNGVSSVYGSDALGGMINVVTKNRSLLTREKDYKINLSLTQGSFNKNAYSIGVEKQSKNLNTSIYYRKENSDGKFKYYFENGNKKILKERGNAAYSIYDVGLNLQYLINSTNRIRFISLYSHQNKNVPGIEAGTPPPATKQFDKNWNNILISENLISPKVTLHTNLNYQNNYMNYKVEPYLNSSYKNIVYAVSPELRYKDGIIRLTGGYNFTHAELKSNELEDGIKRNQHAVFLTSVLEIINSIKLFPSVRYDYISDIKQSAFTYKFGINYQPLKDVDFSIRGNTGKNFRSPSFNDLYWKTGGNRNLHPENSMNAEVGLYYAFNFFIQGQINIGYTYIYAKDKIVWKPQSNGFWSPVNIAKSVSEDFSVSLSTKREISKQFTAALDAGINILNSKKISEAYPGDITKGKFIPYVPLLSSNIALYLNYKFIELNLFYSNIGKRFSDYANTKRINPVSTAAGNIILTTKFWEITSKIKLEVNNIFNVNYQIISGYPMPLRNFQITISTNY